MPSSPDSGGDGGLSWSDVVGRLPDWIWNPAKKIRAVVFGALVGGLLTVFRPILDGLLLVFRGSEPGASRYDPTWGIADLIVALPSIGADILGSVIALYFDVIYGVPEALLGPDPGPVLAAVATVLVVIEILVTIVVAQRVLFALAALVNLDSLTTLIFGR